MSEKLLEKNNPSVWSANQGVEIDPNHYVACWLTHGQGIHGGTQ